MLTYYCFIRLTICISFCVNSFIFAVCKHWNRINCSKC